MFKIVPDSVFVNPSTIVAINTFLKKVDAYDSKFETYKEADDFRTKANIAGGVTEIVEI